MLSIYPFCQNYLSLSRIISKKSDRKVHIGNRRALDVTVVLDISFQQQVVFVVVL